LTVADSDASPYLNFNSRCAPSTFHCGGWGVGCPQGCV